MLKYLFQKDGLPCGAKTLNTITWAVCLTKITLSGVTIAGHTFAVITPDIIQAYAMLMGVTSATYAHRSMKKAGNS